jgi:hypothetical protein
VFPGVDTQQGSARIADMNDAKNNVLCVSAKSVCVKTCMVECACQRG